MATPAQPIPAPPSFPPANPSPAAPAQANSQEMAAISAASRLCDFWCDEPYLWFIQAESILAPQKLGDDAKFNLIVGKLGKDVIQQVSDLLRDPPANKKYEALKTRLISVYEESESRQFEKLLRDMELGDQKPTQLLRRMRDLARGKIPDCALAMLWLRQLPSSVRGVLAVTDTKSPEALAAVADKIMETMRPIDVAEVATTASPHDITREIANLTARFNRLEQAFRGRRQTPQRPRSRSRGRQQPVGPRRTPQDPDWMCYYHLKYKSKARKCVKPCNYSRLNAGN